MACVCWCGSLYSFFILSLLAIQCAKCNLYSLMLVLHGLSYSCDIAMHLFCCFPLKNIEQRPTICICVCRVSAKTIKTDTYFKFKFKLRYPVGWFQKPGDVSLTSEGINERERDRCERDILSDSTSMSHLMMKWEILTMTWNTLCRTVKKCNCYLKCSQFYHHIFMKKEKL